MNAGATQRGHQGENRRTEDCVFVPVFSLWSEWVFDFYHLGNRVALVRAREDHLTAIRDLLVWSIHHQGTKTPRRATTTITRHLECLAEQGWKGEPGKARARGAEGCGQQNNLSQNAGTLPPHTLRVLTAFVAVGYYPAFAAGAASAE
jgi:hypothetical protein